MRATQLVIGIGVGIGIGIEGNIMSFRHEGLGVYLAALQWAGAGVDSDADSDSDPEGRGGAMELPTGSPNAYQ